MQTVAGVAGIHSLPSPSHRAPREFDIRHYVANIGPRRPMMTLRQVSDGLPGA